MIDVESGYLTGSVPWRFDPFFRPTLAVFRGERLLQIVPTQRRPPEPAETSERSWVCEIPARTVRAASHTIIVLETGEIIFGHHDSVEKGEPTTVSALIGSVRRGRTASAWTGFPSFLGLPLADQLTLLSISIPGADLSLERQREIESRIVSGALTILDVRDELLQSGIAGPLASLSMDESPGRWLVWDGLGEIAPLILRRTARPLTDQAEAEDIRLRNYLPSSRPIDQAAEHLSRLALGKTAAPDISARWMREHRDEVERFLERGRVEAGSTSLPLQRGLTWPNLLSALSTGPAGSRSGAITLAQPGSRGLVASGPNLWLRPGSYLARLEVASYSALADAAPVGSAGLLTVEAVYRDLVLARRDVPIGGRAPIDVEFRFRVPDAASNLLGSDGFGIRLWSSGDGGFRISRATLETADRDYPEQQTLEWLSGMKHGPSLKFFRGLTGLFRRPWRVVVFGPYVRLPPGMYRLGVDCSALPCIRGHPIRLSVTRSGSQVVSTNRFRLRKSRQTLTLPFSVPEPAVFEDLYRDLEFVMRAPAGVSVDVTSVHTSPA